MTKYQSYIHNPCPAEYLKISLRSHVYEVAQITPLEIMHKLSKRLKNTVLVKREDRQPVHSFKLRGAYAMISSLNETQKSSGIITASAGNHAQGVAFSAAYLGITSLIVMPVNTAAIKVEAVHSFGGKTLLCGTNFDEAKIKAMYLAKKYQLTFIPPFDHPTVIAGQGTLAMELLQQDAHLDRIFVPVGGGGLAAGIAVLIKHLMPHIKVIGVESTESASLCAALSAGTPVHLQKVGLFAEGVAVRCVGNETFRLCEKYLDDVITVDNDAICAAIKDLFEDVRAIAEPSGALALAGMKKYIQKYAINGERLAHILSGANINFHELRYISERCELGEQREALIAITIPEKKGSFLKFYKILGKRFITEFNYRYNGSKNICIFIGIRLKHGSSEKNIIIQKILTNGFKVIDLSNNEIAKLHIRYMIEARLFHPLQERIFSFEFPESPGALLKFLYTLGKNWNISLFHYRNYGTDYGHVLAGFELSHQKKEEFFQHLSKLGYEWRDVTTNPIFKVFLK
ncbi:threonine ammonia-lyase, biosynthetic [Candidatus Blochmannia ocreatus (nom. nud.)]|uniref:L-threonine dehydratase n=1 Tax=Candidatus Blochmannia ocreatus (nom. nud.) TaxID=251538 RepID=A0ABY4SUI9_9ENTR|nr:threonine ammonia-lyase, biosynthetic [Candidatus Blochmannia ocreatus]URJ25059.1 threonine ammonia-lyase, biosynthetic [Candidatus Blochmannia ocreatus]